MFLPPPSPKKSVITKEELEKKNKFGELSLPDFNTYSKAIGFTIFNWQDRHLGQRNKICVHRPERNLHLWLTGYWQVISMRKNNHFNK